MTNLYMVMTIYFICNIENNYNPFLVYCRELAPGTVSLTGDRAQGDDSKHDSHYKRTNYVQINDNNYMSGCVSLA